MDVIYRQDAIDALDEWESSHSWDAWCYANKDEAEKFHINAPTAVIEKLSSAQPVRKRGYWIEANDSYNRISGRCSVCGWESHMYEDDVVGMDFCPNCGARMERRQDG